MKALIVVDVQNEFSPTGRRPVPNHAAALSVIAAHVEDARREKRPIAWVIHHNKPHEWPAFRPGMWGAELSPGFGPQSGRGPEILFTKEVYGAFTGTGMEEWLRAQGVTAVLMVGFYAHMCLATAVREAIIRGYDVIVDPRTTGARALEHEALGRQSADEVVRSSLLHVVAMGASVFATVPAEHAMP